MLQITIYLFFSLGWFMNNAMGLAPKNARETNTNANTLHKQKKSSFEIIYFAELKFFIESVFKKKKTKS